MIIQVTFCGGCVNLLGFTTLFSASAGDAKGEVLQAQLASGHAKECGWGHSGKSSGPDQGPTACPASFMDVPGVQSAAKLSEQVVGRVNSLLAMMLAAAVSGAQTAAQVSISLRELIPGQGGGRSASLPLDVSETELAALKAHFQELEGRMTTSPSRSGSNRTAWANCKGADLIRSAVAWLLDSDAATQAPGAADSADEKSAQLIRALLAIALSGWTASCSVQNARAVCCHLCGRAVSLSTADLEPLSQHRYFCPVVNRQSEVPLWLTVSTEGKNSVKKAGESQGAAQGWECTLRAVIATFLSSNAADISRDRRQSLEKESTVPTQGAAQVASPAQKHTLSVDTAGGTASSSVVNDGSAGVSVSEGEGSEVSPEQAYKRIRTVLALAAASKI